jgi:GNAT superfamily N-acetyltransferase
LKTGFKKFIFDGEKHILVVVSLDDTVPEIQPLYDITVREASLDDFDEMQQTFREYNRWWLNKENFSKYTSKGHSFLLAIADGKIVGYSFVSSDIVSRNPALIASVIKAGNFKDEDAWGAEAFVLPSYRGKKIYPTLGIETLRWAKRSGFRRILGYVSPVNPSARAAHKKLGGKEIKEVTIYRILFFTRTKIKPLNQDN